MRIILREDVEKLGRRGEVVKVAARIWEKLPAAEGTGLPAHRGQREAGGAGAPVPQREARQGEQAAEDLARRISQLSLTIVRKVGENETLYGSVTNGDIGEALEKEGFGIDKRKILLEEPSRRSASTRWP